MKPSLFHGFLVLDKPDGITSRDAVNRAQGWFPRGTRIGHTGTLDPLATGVLVLAVGQATRLTEYVQEMGKTYKTTICLGATSDSDDADGNITPRNVSSPPTREQIEEAAKGFIGKIAQVPPAYSAAKLSGRRAYELARRGEEVSLSPRTVSISGIVVDSYTYPHLELTVHCGKGAYIRSLARDLGERIGCGGYVEELRRTRVGPFRVEEALSLDADTTTARSRLLPMAMAVCGLPNITLDDRAIQRLQRGGTWLRNDPPLRGISIETGGPLAVFNQEGRLILIAHYDLRTVVLRPDKVLEQSRQAASG
jgi:tRNA pseudouridine55 synthase